MRDTGKRATEEQYNGKRDTGELMKMLMNTVQEELCQNGSFAPVAACIGRSDALPSPVPRSSSNEPAEAVHRLTSLLAKGAAARELRAAAFAADVRFGRRNSDERRDAVQLHIEHEGGYCVEIYVPYRTRRKGWGPMRRSAGWRVRFSHPVAQDATPVFWHTSVLEHIREVELKRG